MVGVALALAGALLGGFVLAVVIVIGREEWRRAHRPRLHAKREG